MPVLYIRSTNVSSCAFVAYVCFRPMLNPERLLHRHRWNCLYRFRTLAWQPGQLRKNGASSVRRAVRCLAANESLAALQCIELAADEKTLLAFEPISRIVPTTITRMTASITAYSAMS